MFLFVPRLLTCLLFTLFLICPAMADRVKIFDIPEEFLEELTERDKDKDILAEDDEHDDADDAAEDVADDDAGDAADDDGNHNKPKIPVVKDPVQTPGEVPFWEQHVRVVKTLEYLLTADAWHYRCFGLLRLERFTGPEVGECVLRAMQDPDWQVRCFALRAAARRGVEVPEGFFDKEPEAKVIRMAQRIGVEINPVHLKRTAEKELRSRVPERAVLGIEIAARSGDPKLVSQAKKRLAQVLQGMNPAVLVTVGDRLAELLDLPHAPTSVAAWQQYLKANAKTLKFPEFVPLNETIRKEAMAPIALMSDKAFLRLVDYVDNLHQQDLQIAVLIDGTGSMGGAIAKAQGQTNRLMITLNDLAQSMEMGVVVYRDEGDKPMLEAVQMTGKITKVRGFLFKVKAQGGGDFPEAVNQALGALGHLNWSSQAMKQAVIITDAPAHKENMEAIQKKLKRMRSDGITLHALTTNDTEETTACLGQIVEWGGGTMKELSESSDLAKTVLHYVIDPKMHDNFDYLYDIYVELGL